VILVTLMHRLRVDQVRLSRDFFAVGFGNIVGGLFGSLPAMCGFSRSAINYASGARSQFSLFISVIAAVIFMLTITPALYYLPKVHIVDPKC